MLAVRKSARVRPIRTGDDNDATRAKVSKQKVKKTTKVAIEPTSKMYATTSNSRRIKRSMDSPATPVPNRKSEEGKTKTPELLETIQEVTENVEILEEPTQAMEQELVQAEETTSSYHNNAEIINLNQETNAINNQVPNTPGQTHKEKLKARRIAKHKKLLEEKRSQGPQTLPRVTEAQFVDLRATQHAKVAKYKNLVGQLYSHPGTNRVYEVVYVYYDIVSKCIACYKRPADGEPSEAEDAYPVKVEGVTGVAQLTNLYLKNSGIYKSTASWPETEEAMFQLQQEDDSLQDII